MGWNGDEMYDIRRKRNSYDVKKRETSISGRLLLKPLSRH